MSRMTRTIEGNMQVTYATFPMVLTPLEIDKYMISQEKARQSESLHSGEPMPSSIFGSSWRISFLMDTINDEHLLTCMKYWAEILLEVEIGKRTVRFGWVKMSSITISHTGPTFFTFCPRKRILKAANKIVYGKSHNRNVVRQ